MITGNSGTTLTDVAYHDRFGEYTEAIVHHEKVIAGRPAPRPVDGKGRLSPRFVEWMMGLPAGWVTDTPNLGRTRQLAALGNGVVPQQAAAALEFLDPQVVDDG